MEVILLKDVKGLGKKGETKTVADGYAQNFLIPRKLVVKKTEESLATLKKENEIEAKKQEDLKNAALEAKVKLESIVLEYKLKAHKDKTPAGSISTKEVEKDLKDKVINLAWNIKKALNQESVMLEETAVKMEFI